MKIGYLLSKSQSVEPFILREIQDVLDSGCSVEAFSLKKGKVNNTSNPSRLVKTNVAISILAPVHLIIGIAQSKRRLVNALYLAAKTKSFINLIIAIMMLSRFRQSNCELCIVCDNKLFTAYYLHLISDIPIIATLHANSLPIQITYFLNISRRTCKDNCYRYKVEDATCEKYKVESNRIYVNKLPPDKAYSDTRFDQFNILMVGRLTPRKGHRVLFEALNILKDRSIRLIIVGSGNLGIHSIAKEYDLSNQLIHFESLSPSQLCFFYDTCDLVCIPSLHTVEEGPEGIPVVLIEAAYRKIPVIATDCGAISEVIPNKYWSKRMLKVCKQLSYIVTKNWIQLKYYIKMQKEMQPREY